MSPKNRQLYAWAKKRERDRLSKWMSSKTHADCHSVSAPITYTFLQCYPKHMHIVCVLSILFIFILFFCCPHIFFFIAVVAMFFLCRQFDVLFFIFLFVFGDLSLHRIGRHCIFFSDAKLRVSVYLFVILMCANFYYDAFHLNDIWVDSNRMNKTHLHLNMS